METFNTIQNNQYNHTLDLFEFEDQYVQTRRFWDLSNNEFSVVLEYVPRQYFRQPNNDQFKVQIWPTNPLYKHLALKPFTDPKLTNRAYEFLKEHTYVGYFSDDCCGPCLMCIVGFMSIIIKIFCLISSKHGLVLN